nr:uncharacterized protein LOC126539099 isoform X3 [Dermacentor andersoni]
MDTCSRPKRHCQPAVLQAIVGPTHRQLKKCWMKYALGEHLCSLQMMKRAVACSVQPRLRLQHLPGPTVAQTEPSRQRSLPKCDFPRHHSIVKEERMTRLKKPYRKHWVAAAAH